MLEVTGVTKIFRSDLLKSPFVALDDVSFKIPSGSMVGFLGANGAGKTTSIKIILDFIRADKGKIEFIPQLKNDRGGIRFDRIGYLPERPYFYPHLTGFEFASFMGELSGMGRKDVKAEITKLAPRFHIEHALNRPLRTYSKGMLQRMGFLVTILHRPELVILDEPLSGLDPVGRLEMKEIMLDLRKAGKTVFFSSHIVPDVEEICDRVIFLRLGKLIYDGSVDRLMKENLRQSFWITLPSSFEKSETAIIRSEKLNEELTRWEVAAENKDKFILEVARGGISIQGVSQDRPSLEEIFYHIRS